MLKVSGLTPTVAARELSPIPAGPESGWLVGGVVMGPPADHPCVVPSWKSLMRPTVMAPFAMVVAASVSKAARQAANNSERCNAIMREASMLQAESGRERGNPYGEPEESRQALRT